MFAATDNFIIKWAVSFLLHSSNGQQVHQGAGVYVIQIRPNTTSAGFTSSMMIIANINQDEDAPMNNIIEYKIYEKQQHIIIEDMKQLLHRLQIY